MFIELLHAVETESMLAIQQFNWTENKQELCLSYYIFQYYLNLF